MTHLKKEAILFFQNDSYSHLLLADVSQSNQWLSSGRNKKSEMTRAKVLIKSASSDFN